MDKNTPKATKLSKIKGAITKLEEKKKLKAYNDSINNSYQELYDTTNDDIEDSYEDMHDDHEDDLFPHEDMDDVCYELLNDMDDLNDDDSDAFVDLYSCEDLICSIKSIDDQYYKVVNDQSVDMYDYFDMDDDEHYAELNDGYDDHYDYFYDD